MEAFQAAGECVHPHAQNLYNTLQEKEIPKKYNKAD